MKGTFSLFTSISFFIFFLTGCPESHDFGDFDEATEEETTEEAGDDIDGDGFTVEDGDCDDSDPSTYPSAEEVCDGKDNNCDDVVDEGCGERLISGEVSLSSSFSVEPEAGGVFVLIFSGDDLEGDYPSSSAIPIDGILIEDVQVWPISYSIDAPAAGTEVALFAYLDQDGDGGTSDGDILGRYESNPFEVSEEGNDGVDIILDTEVGGGDGDDLDGDGYTVEEGDCDDYDPLTYPGASEVCDGNDNDCDSTVDEGCTGEIHVTGDVYLHESFEVSSTAGGLTVVMFDPSDVTGGRPDPGATPLSYTVETDLSSWPVPYELDAPSAGSEVYIFGFLDQDGDEDVGEGDIAGYYSGNPLTIGPSGNTGIDITLSEEISF